jgi:uncharacterized protein
LVSPNCFNPFLRRCEVAQFGQFHYFRSLPDHPDSLDEAVLRQRLNDAYKDAMKSRDARGISTMRMVLAALKDRDIAARPAGNTGGIGESEIVDMLQKMVKQRQESIALYKQGNRPELVQQEEEEIAVIERFLPKQLSETEAASAIDSVLAETKAASVKDMGKVMAMLKERYAGRLDFAKAGALVRQRLSQQQ